MARSGSILYPFSVSSVLWLSSILFAGSIAFSPFVNAQRPPPTPVKGYITSVTSPTDFEVNRRHVKVVPETHFEILGGTEGAYHDSLRDKVRVGTYVEVRHSRGHDDKADNTVTADVVLVRDYWNEELEGLGVIDKVVSTGAEPVFQADGYRIRITSATEVAYAGDLKTLGDVGTNTWLRYEGKRDEAGVLVASKARFFPEERENLLKRALLHESWDMSPKPVGNSERGPNSPPVKQGSVLNADGSLNQDAEIQYSGGFGDEPHRIPMDPPLQERVRRVGMSVVPAYQKLLPDDDPLKIHFRFYAVEDDRNRREICSDNGIIYIPAQILERLRSNDQLAAVLADGVAFNLQVRSALIEKEFLELWGSELAGEVAGVFVPGVELATTVGADVVVHKMQVKMEEQRGRVALALMADAGYDPWQAPEAWRLLAPKKLPRNLDSLKYPSRSDYQLNILNLQYGRERVGKGVNP